MRSIFITVPPHPPGPQNDPAAHGRCGGEKRALFAEAAPKGVTVHRAPKMHRHQHCSCVNLRRLWRINSYFPGAGTLRNWIQGVWDWKELSGGVGGVVGSGNF